MLGHNETQLDSYNKNIPKTSGHFCLIQALSLPTGMKSVFIEKRKDREEQSPNFISLKNIKIYFLQEVYLLLHLKTIQNLEF